MLGLSRVRVMPYYSAEYSDSTRHIPTYNNRAHPPTRSRGHVGYAAYASLHQPFPEVDIPQFEAQSASCATSARAEVAKRFNKLFLAIAQVALRFKENKSFLRFIALRTEEIYNSVRIIALRTEKNLVACALLRCALSEVEILRCDLSD